MELEKCPFCGSPYPEMMETLEGDHFVHCTYCGARTENCDAEAEAAARWNRRDSAPLTTIRVDTHPNMNDILGIADIVHKLHQEVQYSLDATNYEFAAELLDNLSNAKTALTLKGAGSTRALQILRAALDKLDKCDN